MVNAWLRFPDERVAQFTVSYGSEAVSEYRVSGTQGDLMMIPGFTWEKGQTLTVTVKGKKDEETYDKVDQFAGETKYFSDCVLDHKDPEPDGEEGLCDVCVIKAIEKSIATGKVEPVEQVPRETSRARPSAEIAGEPAAGINRRQARRHHERRLNGTEGPFGF
jgi:predicted dehydrogenase